MAYLDIGLILPKELRLAAMTKGFTEEGRPKSIPEKRHENTGFRSWKVYKRRQR